MQNLYDNKKGIYELNGSHLSRNKDNQVVSLHENFVNKVYMLIFYAPWCGHCKRMVDDITKLGETLHNEGFSIGTINCDKHENVANQFKIEGFPTIYFSSNNKSEVYNGSRDLDSLVNHLCKTLNICGKK